MSVIIALKYNNGVVIGADKQATCNNIKYNNVQKIYHSKYSNTAFGGVGSMRDIDILSTYLDDIMDYKDILDNIKLSRQYVIRKIVPKFISTLEENKRLGKDIDIALSYSSFMVADSETIYEIDSDFSVTEGKDYCVLGCGYQLVKGYLDGIHLNELSRPEAIDLVEKCVVECCKDDCYIGEDLDIIVLEKEKKKKTKND